MPEVGVAALPLDYPHSGTAVYLRNLLPRLPEAGPDLSFRVFLRTGDAVDIGDMSAVRIKSPVPAGWDRAHPLVARTDKVLWETFALPLAAARFHEELLHVPYFAAPILSGRRLVVTVHDLIPLVLPGYHRGPASQIYSRLMAWTVPRADAIITVSEHSKRDIIRVLRVPERKIWVIPEAADEMASGSGSGEERSLSERYGISPPYMLYIGGAERRKNIETLVRAWARVGRRARSQGIRLVIVARFPAPDPLYPDIPGLVRELGIEQDVCLVPEVEAGDKRSLYRNAVALCFPSTYEGFGLTPLEAMSVGTPVLASDATSLPEVVGDGGLLLPPSDIAAWADAIVMILESGRERSRLAETGKRRAARFSWRRAADETAGVYRAVLSA